MKILKMLYGLGYVNVSDVARRLGSNFAVTSKHLKVLEAEGILQEQLTVGFACTGSTKPQPKQKQSRIS